MFHHSFNVTGIHYFRVLIPIFQRETCEDGVDSCSMVVYNSPRDGKIHTRKFCTSSGAFSKITNRYHNLSYRNPISSGTPIYQYLLFFPGSALCQNINTVRLPYPNPMDTVIFQMGALSPRKPRGEVSRAKRAAPPAPPPTTAVSHESDPIELISTIPFKIATALQKRSDPLELPYAAELLSSLRLHLPSVQRRHPPRRSREVSERDQRSDYKVHPLRTMLANLNLPTTVTSEEDIHRAGPAPPQPKPFGKPNVLKPHKGDKDGIHITTSEPF